MNYVFYSKVKYSNQAIDENIWWIEQHEVHFLKQFSYLYAWLTISNNLRQQQFGFDFHYFCVVFSWFSMTWKSKGKNLVASCY